jgi:hypothetical protein
MRKNKEKHATRGSPLDEEGFCYLHEVIHVVGP